MQSLFPNQYAGIFEENLQRISSNNYEYPTQCTKCTRKNPNYVLGSTILTLGIAGLVFLVSLSWSQYINKKLDLIVNEETEVQVRLYYAIVLTLAAIVVIFLLLYYLPGEKC